MNRNSRLLQLVVAGVLLSQGGSVAATTYDDDRVSVPGSYWGGTSTTFEPYPEAPEEAYDYDYYDFSGDGSSGSGNDSSDTDDEADQAVCEAIAADAPEDCDLLNPPVFSANGCGGGLFANVVPDFLVVNGTPVTRLGPIFAASCNRHDFCYANHPGDKDRCDAQLASDMISRARDQMSTFQWSYYERHVRFQASLYNVALQTQPTSTIATYFFNVAQTEGECRNVAKRSEEAGCND